MSDRSQELYRQDILDAINRITRYVKGMSYEQFRSDEKTVDAVVRNIEIIGEATRNSSFPSPFDVTRRGSDTRGGDQLCGKRHTVSPWWNSWW